MQGVDNFLLGFVLLVAPAFNASPEWPYSIVQIKADQMRESWRMTKKAVKNCMACIIERTDGLRIFKNKLIKACHVRLRGVISATVPNRLVYKVLQ